MWKTKKVLCITFLSVLSLFLSLPSHGTCAPTQVYTISETELETLQSHLDALEANNETLKSILSESGEELTQALNALTQSQAELTRLKAELIQCRSDAESARNSLQIANDELQKASESFKQYERERDKTENRLRNQRNIWEVLCLVAVGVAVAR